jgi:cytochrome c oxidase assembly protein subunit 11
MSPAARSNLIALACGAMAAGMVGAAFAAVPLYRIFCEATGFDGTVKRGDSAQLSKTQASTRMITVRFDTNVRNLPWTFKPEEKSQTIKLGTPGQAWFKVRNDSDQPITGRATFNVTPEQAGAYFVKTQCFCFDDQTIPAQTEMRFPVIYFVQPGFADDRDTQNFDEVTLSYTFFQSTKPAKPAAVATAKPLGAASTPRL